MLERLVLCETAMQLCIQKDPVLGDGCSRLATSFVFWLESICAPQIGRSSIYVFPTSFPCSMKERPAHNQLILLLFVCLIQFRIIKFYYYHIKDVLLI